MQRKGRKLEFEVFEDGFVEVPSLALELGFISRLLEELGGLGLEARLETKPFSG